MKAFRFRLAQVLAWREQQYEATRARLAQCRTELAAVEARLARAIEDRDAARLSLLGSRLEAPELAALAPFLARMDKLEEALLKERSVCLRKCAETEQSCLQLRSQCLLLSKLKERRKAEYDLEVSREIENTAAELFLARVPSVQANGQHSRGS